MSPPREEGAWRWWQPGSRECSPWWGLGTEEEVVTTGVTGALVGMGPVGELVAAGARN